MHKVEILNIKINKHKVLYPYTMSSSTALLDRTLNPLSSSTSTSTSTSSASSSASSPSGASPPPLTSNRDENEDLHAAAASSSSFNFQNKATHREEESEEAGDLYFNFISFSVLYSITHACVDAVLAFSVAELGSRVGSFGGFSLYICYTLSALFIARPILLHVNSKTVVLFGLAALLVYVLSFFIAIMDDSSAETVFVIGSCIGGLGAGCLWTAQVR